MRCSVTMLASLPPRNSTAITSFCNGSLRLHRTLACADTLRFRSAATPHRSSVALDSLRLLGWDKLCDSVSSFAATSPGRSAAKEKLWWSAGTSYEESVSLLSETSAAVEMLKYSPSSLDFAGVDLDLVKSAIDNASRNFPMRGIEAMAVVGLLELGERLQNTLKEALKEDSDWYNRFMPLADMITGLVVNRTFIKAVQQVIDEDGSVKDSASSELRRFRAQVKTLERKVYQLLDNLVKSNSNEEPSIEVSNADGRWCIKMGADQFTNVKGLLLSSGSGIENLIEPVSAVPLNDELQQARALVAKAEQDVLSKLTDKMREDLEDILHLLSTIVQLDVVSSRAKYSIAYGATWPDLSLSTGKDGSSISADNISVNQMHNNDSYSHPNQRKWTLYMKKAYNPLLLQQYREKLRNAKDKVINAISDIRRRRLQGENMMEEENDDHLTLLKNQVTSLEENHPVPVDISVSIKTRVLVITGPNTGGKTICLKTIGLAALMARSGLYVLASEPVSIPWFDSVLADIGDEQSLAQSLSTFSGHLKQISAIKSNSTNQSLVLLDEVGAGTNPLEGAALGMSLLQCFAESGALLTIATTHHGELKTLKYSNRAFENACVEFDEVNMKPTYKILWGVPGRSNAISIAERLGVPNAILDDARMLYGTASAEINRIILEMEKFKQDFQKHLQEGEHYLMFSRKLHGDLLKAKQRIADHTEIQRRKKVRIMSEFASRGRSLLRKKLQRYRESAMSRVSPSEHAEERAYSAETPTTSPSSNLTMTTESSDINKTTSENGIKIPKVGDMVHVSSMGKKVMVLKVNESKSEVVVQAGSMKLKLKLNSIKI
ncbi:DNA mismatch repair protein MSH7 [Acorus calamus]|uniref:DNA mismatch repair protein MSH7 n=1 Tax=Acorus calamus TaxID=4465 RepID=A0AAV9CBJ8_ACOCL|nr:DNA mismatch repair protein MSH7 [Acorus calamus]